MGKDEPKESKPSLRELRTARKAEHIKKIANKRILAMEARLKRLGKLKPDEKLKFDENGRSEYGVILK